MVVLPIRKLVARKLQHLKRKIEVIASIEPETVEICLLQQYEVSLSDYKIELRENLNDLLALDIDDKDELSITQSSLEEIIFKMSFEIRKQLQLRKDASLRVGHGVKLPKLEVPT